MPAEHSGEFFDAGVGVEGGDIGFGTAVNDGFADDVMRLSNGGNGRQVGNAKHLALVGNLAHSLADGVGRFGADVGIDFVENLYGDGIFGGEYGLQC